MLADSRRGPRESSLIVLLFLPLSVKGNLNYYLLTVLMNHCGYEFNNGEHSEGAVMYLHSLSQVCAG